MTARTVVVRLGVLEAGAAEHAGRFAGQSAGGGIPARLAGPWLALFCVDTAEPVVAITYDDGPNPADTPRLLEVLRRRGARATFFVLAEHVERHPELARRIAAEGHELALHGVDHTSLRTLGAWAGIRRVRAARRRVEAATGVRVRRYRPPYGAYTTAQLIGLRLSGLDVVIWSGDAVDWRDDDVEAVAERAIAGAHPGGILLLHDERADPESLGDDETLPAFDRVRVLERLLDALDAQGYRTTTVGELAAGFPNVRSIARYRPAAG